MENKTTIDKEFKTYIFKIAIEPDPFPDGRIAYHAYCPALKDYSASTWGYTREEAIKKYSGSNLDDYRGNNISGLPEFSLYI